MRAKTNGVPARLKSPLLNSRIEPIVTGKLYPSGLITEDLPRSRAKITPLVKGRLNIPGLRVSEDAVKKEGTSRRRNLPGK